MKRVVLKRVCFTTGACFRLVVGFPHLGLETKLSFSEASPKTISGLGRKFVILKDIAKLQESTETLIPKAAVGRLVEEELDAASQRRQADRQEGVEEFLVDRYKMSSDALKLLQEASEAHLVDMFSNMNVLARHRKAVTIEPRDLNVLRYLKQ